MSTILSKSLFASKIFWLGVIQVLVGVMDLIKTNVLDSETAAWGAVATGAVTVILRVFFTSRPVTVKGGDSVPVDPPKTI